MAKCVDAGHDVGLSICCVGLRMLLTAEAEAEADAEDLVVGRTAEVATDSDDSNRGGGGAEVGAPSTS